MTWLAKNWPRLLVHAAALAPLGVLALRALSESLPINLNRYLMLRSGMIALILLAASLACTPLNRLLGWQPAVRIRRPLGVYGFLYASAHLAVYAIFENSLDLELIWRDLGERRSMLIGMVALALLVPLAATSTSGWQRRLGRRWRTLHKLVYLATPLSVLHYLWLDRDIVTLPWLFVGVVALLLVLRLPALRRAIGRRRQA
jgi:sulfoxide reductase heme-binding subunit YedZ